MELSTLTSTTISRWVRYHRTLPNVGFSLEANTEAVPQQGFFYVFRGGEVIHCGDDFDVATVIYRELCQEYWQSELSSVAPARRMESAWGLLGQDLEHHAAAEVIRKDGQPADQARLVKLRARALAMRRHALAKNGRR